MYAVILNIGLKCVKKPIMNTRDKVNCIEIKI